MMSKFLYDGINIYYEEYKGHQKSVVLLHGWGQNTIMMDFIAQYLKDYFNVINIDLPGFGKSDEPLRAYSVDDYVLALKALLDDKHIDNPIFIGHSFGCRIALRYAYKYGAYKMVLTGAAGVRDKHGLKWYFKTYTYKLGKWIILHSPYKDNLKKLQDKKGSEDYKNASGVMRETLVKVVNDDVSNILKEINTETLLVFGELDKATPVSKGKYMEKMMPNAALCIFEGDDHYAYFHQSNRFLRVLDAFLRSDYD